MASSREPSAVVVANERMREHAERLLTAPVDRAALSLAFSAHT